MFSPEQAREMRDLHSEGWTGVKLAERFGCSATTISAYLANGKEPQPTGARQAIDEFVQALGPLDAERRAVAAIAVALADRVDGARAAGSAAVAARTLAELVEKLAGDVRRGEAEVQARRALRAVGLA